MTTKSIQQFSNLLPRSEHRSQTAKTLDSHPIQRDTRSRRQPHQRRHCIAPRSQHTVERGTQTTRRPGLGRFSTLIDWPQGVSHTTSPAVLTHRAHSPRRSSWVSSPHAVLGSPARRRASCRAHPHRPASQQGSSTNPQPPSPNRPAHRARPHRHLTTSPTFPEKGLRTAPPTTSTPVRTRRITAKCAAPFRDSPVTTSCGPSTGWAPSRCTGPTPRQRQAAKARPGTRTHPIRATPSRATIPTP